MMLTFPLTMAVRYISYTFDVLQKAPKQNPLVVIDTDHLRHYLGLELADMALVAALLGSDYTKQFLNIEASKTRPLSASVTSHNVSWYSIQGSLPVPRSWTTSLIRLGSCSSALCCPTLRLWYSCHVLKSYTTQPCSSTASQRPLAPSPRLPLTR